MNEIFETIRDLILGFIKELKSFLPKEILDRFPAEY